MSQPTGHSSSDPEVMPVHAVPLEILAGVFVLLMGLTVATVAATWIDLGSLNIVIALGIALVKGAFVCLYFMHLRYDSPLYSVIVVTALLFVVLFIGIVLLDSKEYQPTIDAAVQAATPAAAPK